MMSTDCDRTFFRRLPATLHRLLQLSESVNRGKPVAVGLNSTECGRDASSCTGIAVCAAVAMVLVTTIMGCGGGPEPPELVSVTGRVMNDGEPVTVGAIYFHADEGNSWKKDTPGSLLQLDGSFTIKTYPFGDGVPPGRYKVTLAPELAARIKKQKYATPQQTPWEVEVPVEGLTDHVLVVE